MAELTKLRTSEQPLKRRLFGYMIFLVAILLLALVLGLFFIGRFGSVREETYEKLDIQMQVFAKEITGHYDNLSYRAIQLSEEMTQLLEEYFEKSGGTLDRLTDSADGIKAVQDAMFDPLRQRLLQAECSGAFVLLDATINSSIPDAQLSRSGLYLQPCDYQWSDADVLFYRGIADVGERHGAMAHRKWRQEFRTNEFPDYEAIMDSAALPLETAYRISTLTMLPGTSERAMLLCVPMIGSDGTVYGICGFEINESYFKLHHSQASNLKHLTCLMATEQDGVIHAASGLSAGITNGYYFVPKCDLTVSDLSGGLKRFSADLVSHVGVMREISLYDGDPGFVLCVMIPKVDYDRELAASVLQLALLISLLVFFAVTCSLFFSKHFLKPVLDGLEQLKNRSDSPVEATRIPEIDDLFRFLEAQDKAHEEAISQMERDAANKHAKMQAEYEAAQAEINRLAYERDKEIDPDDYRLFLEGMQSFTPAESNVFQYYLAGKSSKEILELMGIKDSTLRYHNRNIYQKLGVNSLKQMIRYGALVRQKENQDRGDG